ncbi:MAG: transposase, partial [Anaerolineae bacterium]|nr:transposase [Anaerolineae bacterium]
YLRFQQRTFKGSDVQKFLVELLRAVRGPIILLWDRSPTHKDRGVQAFIQKHPRLHCEYFPGYAPELNPAEFVWTQADAALANSAPDDLTELRTRLNKSKRRLCNSQQLKIFLCDLCALWQDSVRLSSYDLLNKLLVTQALPASFCLLR